MKEHHVNYWLQRALIAPDWPHSITVISYSSFYYLLPLQTHTDSLGHTHTRRLSHFQHHHSPFHCLHFTCRTSLKHGIREFCWQEENLQDAFSKLCAACSTRTPWCSASFSRAPFHSERPQDSGGTVCALPSGSGACACSASGLSWD